MSKIGKQSIILPSGVEMKADNSEIVVKGPKGEVHVKMMPSFSIQINGQEVSVIPPSELSKDSSALWGTLRALLQNAVDGVAKGFEKRLVLEGVGFRSMVEGDNLNLTIGLSHPVKFPIPVGIRIVVEKEGLIIISGIDKDLVGRTAAEIRATKKPEPYKGKGIHYKGEIIRRKDGKKAASTTA